MARDMNGAAFRLSCSADANRCWTGPYSSRSRCLYSLLVMMPHSVSSAAPAGAGAPPPSIGAQPAHLSGSALTILARSLSVRIDLAQADANLRRKGGQETALAKRRQALPTPAISRRARGRIPAFARCSNGSSSRSPPLKAGLSIPRWGRCASRHCGPKTPPACVCSFSPET